MTTLPSPSMPTVTGEVWRPPPDLRVTMTARWFLATNSRAWSGVTWPPRLRLGYSALYEEGLVVKGRTRGSLAGAWGSSLYRLLDGEEQVDGRLRLAQFRQGSSGDQSAGRGPCRSEWLLTGEHVPDGLGELAGNLHPGDPGAPLLAEPLLGALVVVAVARMLGGVDGRLDQRPTQLWRAVLGQRAALIAAAGLVHPGTQPGVAAQLAWATRTGRCHPARRQWCSPAPTRSRVRSSAAAHRGGRRRGAAGPARSQPHARPSRR